MRNGRNHRTDEELLLAVDGELPPRRAAYVRAHLEDCASCRARMQKIKETAAGVVRAYRAELDPELASSGSSRAALRAQVHAQANDSKWPRWFEPVAYAFAGGRWAYVCGALAIAALGIYTLFRQVLPSDAQQTVVEAAAAPLVPDSNLTPGATRPIAVNQVCTPGPEDQMATIPITVRKAVFHEYGMDAAQPRQYEVDHLITPELGGTDDIRNLWPEPYTSTMWNAHVKDQLEDRLRQLVCEGKLNLTTAQRDMATNWISAYQKYFHTDRPLPEASASSGIKSARRDTERGDAAAAVLFSASDENPVLFASLSGSTGRFP